MAADDMMQAFRTKPVTNGDYIRQMTDEELHKTLGLSCFRCAYANTEQCRNYACGEGTMKWLKSPRDAG